MRSILFIVIFNILSIVSLSAEIVYIDINYIINSSDVGKILNKKIKLINDKNIQKFKTLENDLIKKEQALLAQENILEKTEFTKKISELSDEIKKYREEKKLTQNELNQFKLTNTKKIVNLLNPIITEYVEVNSILLVIPKKNIIVGKKNLDITNAILEIFNNKEFKINF